MDAKTIKIASNIVLDPGEIAAPHTMAMNSGLDIVIAARMADGSLVGSTH